MPRRRLRRKLPWLPKAEDDELQRQLDLLLWGKTYQRARAQADQAFTQRLLHRLPPAPAFQDYHDLRRFMQDDDVWRRRLTALKQERERGPFHEATAAALRGADCTWTTTRQMIYERDGGYCMVCGDPVPWKYYECGHIIDRVVGGSDRLSNLVLMCNVDNRLKPLTETRDAYLAWARHGGAIRHVFALAHNLVNGARGEKTPPAPDSTSRGASQAHESHEDTYAHTP